MEPNSHRTQIIVAIIGVVGVLGTAVITNWDRIFPARTPEHAGGNGTEQQSTLQAGRGNKDLQLPGVSECFRGFFAGLSQDRVVTLERGALDAQVIGPHQSREQPVGILLTEDRRVIGAIIFEFFSANSLFKIRSVVDLRCQPVEEYRNASRGGDKHLLQNWDNLDVQLAGAGYSLRFGYDQGIIDVDFARTSVQ